MSAGRTSAMSWEEAQKVLGVAVDADEARIRVAYLEKVRQHPPDRDPFPVFREKKVQEKPDRQERHRHVDTDPCPQSQQYKYPGGKGPGLDDPDR